MSWDDYFMGMARFAARKSKDRSRRVGAVIVDERNVVVSTGWNGFPRGIDDTVEARHERPTKYRWTEHAERNAIYNAAATGARTLDCTIYSTLYPCADCARAIIQAGIVELVTTEPDWSETTHGHTVAREMLAEARVDVRFVERVGS
ncbi:deoxycytidylate deaminase [Stappia sp. 22II-S9-Z10]|nr:deoxycytidylate deaminase [Stappia sp. 22II-S9-Z10]